MERDSINTSQSGCIPELDRGQVNPFEEDTTTEPLAVDALSISLDGKNFPQAADDNRIPLDPTSELFSPFIPDTPRELLNTMKAAPVTLAEFCCIDDASVPAGVLEGDDSNKDVVWEDSPNCVRCGLVFGLPPRRRHHCRICGKSVCATCSPNSAQLHGMKGLQRVCTACIEDAEKAPVAKRRMSQLGNRLYRALGAGRPPNKSTDTLEDATTFCEQVLVPLEELQAALVTEKQRADQLEIQVERERLAKQQLEAKAQAAREHIVHVGDVIYSHCGTKSAPTAPALCSLDDAMAFCDAALAHSHVRLKALELHSARSSTKDAEIQTEDVRLESLAIADEDENRTPLVNGEASLSLGRQMSSMIETEVSYFAGEASHCSVCFASLGKRFLNLRHHCRICEKTVCGTCSPNNVQLTGMKGLQRACKLCISIAQASPVLTKRLMKLGGQLHQLAQSASVTPAGGIGLDEAVAFCEEALIPLRVSHARHEEMQHLANLAQKELETRAQSAKDSSEKIGDCLKCLKNKHPVQADPNNLAFWDK